MQFQILCPKHLLKGLLPPPPPPLLLPPIPPPPSSTLLNARTIYLIDDEESLRSAIGTFLSNNFADSTTPYTIQTFESATSALDTINKLVERSSTESIAQLPDLIISDIRMPDVDGIEFLHTIRDYPNPAISNVPFILLTAKGMTGDRIEGYKAGANSYLPKPFDPDELCAIVDSLIKAKENPNSSSAFASTSTSTSTSMDSRLFDAIGQNSDSNIDFAEIKKELASIKEMLGGNISVPKTTNNSNAARMKRINITPKEREVLVHVFRGLMNKEIAVEQKITVRSVEKHISSMMLKSGTYTRTELLRWALETGRLEYDTKQVFFDDGDVPYQE